MTDNLIDLVADPRRRPARPWQSFRRSFRRYFAFSRISFQELLAYRMRYYTGIFTYFIHVSVYYYLWTSIYEAEGAVVAGYGLSEILTYMALGWVTRAFYFNNIDWDMAQDVIEGRIGVELTRPVNYQAIQYFSALGEALFRFLLFAVPISVVIFLVYPVQGPASVACGALFGVSIIFSMLIFSGLNFLTGVVAVYLKSVWGLVRAKQMIIQVLSGQIVPLAFFPEAAREILTLLPFAGIAHVPLQIYLGRFEPQETALALGLQAFWALALVGFGALAWRASMRRLVIQGG